MKRYLGAFIDRSGIGPVVRPIYSALRRKTHQAGLKLAALSSRRRVERYLATSTSARLHIGASSRSIAGWLNTDIVLHSRELVYLDCTRPFPVGDAVFDFAYCEHVIEHLTEEQGAACMAEVFRCLKKGGVFRIATPDLEKFVGLFSAERTSAQDRYLVQFGALLGLEAPTPGKVLNLVMRAWGHRHIYARADLAAALRKVGFSDVVSAEVGDSRHPALSLLERHHEFAGEEANRFETMIIEATKA